MDDELDELRALGRRLGPSQALRAMRRSGLETMETRSGGMHIDDAMLKRHEHLTRQRAADGDDDGQDLERRRRQLELLRLGA